MNTAKLYQRHLTEQDAYEVQRIQREAESTPGKDKELALHIEAIEVLRAKGYSYRDIATWFSERGYKVNHVDVWRAHKNGMEAEDYLGAADYDEEWKEFIRKKKEGEVTVYEEVDGEVEKAEAAKLAPQGEAPIPNQPATQPNEVNEVSVTEGKACESESAIKNGKSKAKKRSRKRE